MSITALSPCEFHMLKYVRSCTKNMSVKFHFKISSACGEKQKKYLWVYFFHTLYKSNFLSVTACRKSGTGRLYQIK